MAISSLAQWLRHSALALAVGSAGCSTFSIRADRCPAYPIASAAASAGLASDVKVQYLGVGGYLVSRGDDVVLFGPEYSNPGIAEVMFDHQIRTDRALVDRLLLHDANKAQAIVIGHSHYDHLLDTPYIANNKATQATVYGSTTMANLIASAVAPDRLFDVAERLADIAEASPGQTWIPIGQRMRLTPITSEHSDQFRLKVPLTGINQPVHAWRGEVTDAQSALPTTASGWAEGQVYAYLLDFMDASGNIEFRIYYQDSGTNAPMGFPVPDGKKVDVALICLGGDFERLTWHPEAIIEATQPRFLILGHWEDFFVPQTDICTTGRVAGIPLQDTEYFVARAQAALKAQKLPGKPILPCPTASVFFFPIDVSDDGAVHKALKNGRATYDCAR